jgi:hypothetical protein
MGSRAAHRLATVLVLAFVHGSLEMYPTEEQYGKARIFWLVCALLCLSLTPI